MPTRNVNLTPELDHFVATRIERGRFENASEVMRQGLRLLQEREQDYDSKAAILDAALKSGEESGIYPGDPFEAIECEFNIKLNE